LPTCAGVARAGRPARRVNRHARRHLPNRRRRDRLGTAWPAHRRPGPGGQRWPVPVPEGPIGTSRTTTAPSRADSPQWTDVVTRMSQTPKTRPDRTRPNRHQKRGKPGRTSAADHPPSPSSSSLILLVMSRSSVRFRQVAPSKTGPLTWPFAASKDPLQVSIVDLCPQGCPTSDCPGGPCRASARQPSNFLVRECTVRTMEASDCGA